MNVLVIESDDRVRQAAEASIRRVLRGKRPSIATVGDLLEAAGLLATTGIRFDLIICAETVEETGGDGRLGNGLDYLIKVRPIHTAVIILADRDVDQIPTLPAVPRRPARPRVTGFYLDQKLRELWH